MQNRTKRLLAALLALTLLCGLAACGAKTEVETTAAAPATTAAPTTAAPTTAAPTTAAPTTQAKPDETALFRAFFDSAQAESYYQTNTEDYSASGEALVFMNKSWKLFDLNGDGVMEALLCVDYGVQDETGATVPAGFDMQRNYLFALDGESVRCVFSSPLLSTFNNDYHFALLKDVDGVTKAALWFSRHKGVMNEERVSFYTFDGKTVRLQKSCLSQETRPTESSKGPVYLISEQYDLVDPGAANYLDPQENITYEADGMPVLSAAYQSMETDAMAFYQLFNKVKLSDGETGCETLYSVTEQSQG